MAALPLLMAFCAHAGPAQAAVVTQADGWVYVRVPDPLEEVTDDPPPSSTPGTGALTSAALHRTGADAQMSATASLGSVHADASADAAAGAHVKAFRGEVRLEEQREAQAKARAGVAEPIAPRPPEDAESRGSSTGA